MKNCTKLRHDLYKGIKINAFPRTLIEGEIFLHLDYGELMHSVEKSQAIGRNRVAIMMFLSFVTALGISKRQELQ